MSALRMALRTLGPKQAAALDEELMSSGAFSIDQLMELAGLSVAQAVYRLHPPATPASTTKVLVACGPGNNGGDGLVAARHLHHFAYAPTVYYPKRPGKDIYGRLSRQLEQLGVPVTDALPGSLNEYAVVVDAVFGFSFSGDVREPFPAAIRAFETSPVPVLAVDAPSSWNIETGPPRGDGAVGANYMPAALISLTAPKPLVKFFKGGRHFVGGRFLGKTVAEKYGIDVPPYTKDEQIVEVAVDGGKL